MPTKWMLGLLVHAVITQVSQRREVSSGAVWRYRAQSGAVGRFQARSSAVGRTVLRAALQAVLRAVNQSDVTAGCRSLADRRACCAAAVCGLQMADHCVRSRTVTVFQGCEAELAQTVRQLEGVSMLNPIEEACVRACQECATACLQCATACLQEAEPKPMARCIALDLECADICALAAASMARGGEHMQAICALCATACSGCAAECKKHSMDHCKRCAQACERCAQACLAMAH